MTESNIQIGLSIGNSRYHWAWFVDTQLQSSWDSEYLTIDQLFDHFPINLQTTIKTHSLKLETIPLYLTSVVPNQTASWQQLPQVKLITLADIPLSNLYPTLGIDRALSIFGAGETYGYPVLVIDSGTALTITGIDDHHHLIGGAILPGLRLQLRSLATGTAALPEIDIPAQLPTRWSDNTPDSIASGILYTVTAGIKDFIQDWRKLYPHSQIVFTGGDGKILYGYLQVDLIANTSVDRQLLFYGLAAILSRL
jgi:type III pantothenate kinase